MRDKIQRAVELRAEGLSYRKIAERLGVAHSTVQYWLKPECASRQRRSVLDYQQTDRGHETRQRYARSEGGLQTKRKYRQGTKDRTYHRERRLASEHPEVTYIIGSPGCNRVIIGKTINWEQRALQAYNKSLYPLSLLAMTRIPERAIHERFRHLRVPGYSPEVFEVDSELREFIDSFSPIFRYQENFVGVTTPTTPSQSVPQGPLGSDC